MPFQYSQALLNLKILSSIVSASIIFFIVAYALCCRKRCCNKCSKKGKGNQKNNVIYKVKDFVVLPIISFLEFVFFIAEIATSTDTDDENFEVDAWIWGIIVVEMELVLYWFMHQSHKWTLTQLILAILSLSFSILYTWVLVLVLLFHTHVVGAVGIILNVIFITHTIISFALFGINVHKRCHAGKFAITNSACLDFAMNCILLVICCLSIGVVSILFHDQNVNFLDSTDNQALWFNIFFLIYRLLMLVSCILMFLMIHDRTETQAYGKHDDTTVDSVSQNMGNYYQSIKWKRLSVAVIGEQNVGKSVLIRELTGMPDKSETELHMIDIYRKWDPKTKTNYKFWDTIGDRRFIWHTLDCMAKSDIIVIVISLFESDHNKAYSWENDEYGYEYNNSIHDDTKERFDTSIDFVKNMNDEIKQAYKADGYRFEDEDQKDGFMFTEEMVQNATKQGTLSHEMQQFMDYEKDRLLRGPLFKKFPCLVVSLHTVK